LVVLGDGVFGEWLYEAKQYDALIHSPFSGGENYATDYRNGGALAGLGRLCDITYAGF
jgi:hypothetical protein